MSFAVAGTVPLFAFCTRFDLAKTVPAHQAHGVYFVLLLFHVECTVQKYMFETETVVYHGVRRISSEEHECAVVSVEHPTPAKEKRRDLVVHCQEGEYVIEEWKEWDNDGKWLIAELTAWFAENGQKPATRKSDEKAGKIRPGASPTSAPSSTSPSSRSSMSPMSTASTPTPQHAAAARPTPDHRDTRKHPVRMQLVNVRPVATDAFARPVQHDLGEAKAAYPQHGMLSVVPESSSMHRF